MSKRKQFFFAGRVHRKCFRGVFYLTEIDDVILAINQEINLGTGF
jgi:hypothetical protein